MTTPVPFPKLSEAYRALHAALAEIEPEADRRVARDALRDALDRARNPDWRHAGILADTFAIEGTINEGPAFTLHLLRHRDLGTQHVLKTVRDDRRHEPVLRDMLLSEGAHMLALSHPAILTARAVLRLADGRPGLLLDHVEGSTLADHVEAQGPLGVEDARALAARLLDALAAIHAAGLLHLDLTPANILLPHGRLDMALVCDFGLSLRNLECHGGRELAFAASEAFASPEQLCVTVPLDGRADLFALGRVIEMCRASDKGDSLRHWTAGLTSADRTMRVADTYKAKLLLDEATAHPSLPQ